MLIRAALSRIVTLIFTLCVCFIALEALPGDACTTFLEQDAHDKLLLQNCRVRLGIDQPVAYRLEQWMIGLMHGDFGVSLSRNRPVVDVLAPRVRNTFLLAGLSALIAVPISIGLGVLAAVKRDSVFDVTSSALFLIVMTVPEFVIATIFVLIFSVTLRVLPAITVVSDSDSFLEFMSNAVLPIAVLSLVMIAHIMRVMRTSMIDILASDFVQVGKLRGLPFSRLILRHALPSALPPTLNVVAMSLASLLGGVVVVERVFNYPGLGTLTLQAIHDRDMPVVQATVIIFTMTYVVLTLITDITSSLVDPRIRRRVQS